MSSLRIVHVLSQFGIFGLEIGNSLWKSFYLLGSIALHEIRKGALYVSQVCVCALRFPAVEGGCQLAALASHHRNLPLCCEEAAAAGALGQVKSIYLQ